MNAPDYSSYTLAELLDARSHIDEERFPERRAALDAEIAAREVPGESTTDPSATPTPVHERIPKYALAVYLVASGLVSLGVCVTVVFRPGGGAGTAGMGAGLVWTYIFAVYGSMFLSGVALLKRWKFGLRLAYAAVVLQLPLVQVGRITYVLSAYPLLEFKIWPRFGLGFQLGAKASILWHSAERPLYLGLNLFALGVLSILSYHLHRRRAAVARLRKRSDRSIDPVG